MRFCYWVWAHLRWVSKWVEPEFMRLLFVILVVLIAFAGNSVLARLALSSNEIGPWGFSLIRFLTGSLILLALSRPKKSWPAGRWSGAFTLCIYGVFFSFAYLQLATGTGALLLFASVQLTMLAIAFSHGEKLSVLQWLGLALAMVGLAYLLAPGIEAPSPIGAILMVFSGIGWGIYSVLGKGTGYPIAKTAGNFSRATIIIILLSPLVLFALPEQSPSLYGLSLAVLSGTVTSGLGYALWYSVLKHISVTTAAISQLSVPVIAAIGGAMFVFEPVSLAFAISCTVVLLGVAIATIKPSASSE